MRTATKCVWHALLFPILCGTNSMRLDALWPTDCPLSSELWPLSQAPETTI